METRRVEALLVVVLFLSHTSTGVFLGVIAPTSAYRSTYELIPPMPQLSSEASALNFTIPYPVPRPAAVPETVTVLVIAVDFRDYNHTLAIEQVTNQTIGQLNEYYHHVSYGATNIVGRSIGWVRLPYGMSSYGMDNGPFVDDQDGDGYPDSWRLLRDALPLLGEEVNLADYQQIVVLHAGYGQESSKVQNDIWSVTFMRWLIETSRGNVERFAVVPEYEAKGLGTLGVNAHEFGHLLGLPDLYSTANEQVGPWDLMARGAWNGNPPGTSPAELIAWDRIFFGWIGPDRVLNVTRQMKVNATVDPIEMPSSRLHAIRVQPSPQDSQRYYLVEVRQKIGYDSALPSAGVLITYIDETKSTPVKVIDAVQTSSTLNDAPFQAGQKYLDAENNLSVAVASVNGTSYTIIVDATSPTADLVVSSLTVDPRTVHPGDTASVTAVVANEGTLKTKTFVVSLYLNDTLFVSRQTSLGVGKTEEIRSAWTPEKAGVYLFKVVVDSKNQVAEASEENNVKVLTVVVGYSLTLEVRPPGAGEDIMWWLLVNGVNQTFVGVGEFQVGVVPGNNTLQIQPIIYLGPDSRCVFQQWSDGSTSNPRIIDVLTDISLSADFSQQFLLSLEPNGGFAGLGGWYDSGSVATVTATSPSTVADRQSRLLFLNWSGDVDSNSTSLVLNMTRPYNIVANWQPQYYLYIESPYSASGEGWYDADTQAAVSLSPTVTSDNGTRHVFVQWTGDLSGVEPSGILTMSGPKRVSALWTMQYELRIESEYGHVSGAGWFDPSTTATFIVDPATLDTGNGTRRVFTGWSGDSVGTDPQGMLVMNEPKTVRAGWDTQYQLTFAVHGIRNGTTLTVTVDGQPYEVTVPETLTVWHDTGSGVSFSTNATVGETFRRSLFDHWTNSTGERVESPQGVVGPETYTATYMGGSMSPCIIATVTFGSEVSLEVQFLRDFRDRLALSTRAGSAFMTVFNMWYYSFSPQVANFIAGHDAIRSPIRVAIYPLIGILEASSATYSALMFSPEIAVVAAGALASALIGLVYLTPVDLLFVRLLRKRGVSARGVLKAFCALCSVALIALLLGEATGSFILLALSSSTLVLTILISTPLLFSLFLVNERKQLTHRACLKRVGQHSVNP